MGKRTKVSTLREFDMAELLDSDAAVADYINIVLAEDDQAALAEALGTVARARGMTAIAEGAGIGREALYKALRPGADPRFDTIRRVCAALGVRLIAVPTT
ncbi:MAG: putative addiction module antidote protein [Burkholderiales bacterium]|nr:putative addiction module antidote protein [Burkholderiales bacterium]MCE7876793.1 putative addiction module antidote protein [Betaproteobacteria bacterium PRO3]